MMKKFVAAACGAVLLFSYSDGFASGLSKPVLIGPKAIGMGGAFVAIVDDPTAVFHNPAGMTQLEGHKIYAGMDGLITDLDYTFPAATTEKADTEFLPVPSFSYVTGMFEPISLGLGLFFPHGNGGKFPGASANPANPLEGRIYSMEIAPAIAWKMIPELSLGATLRLVRVSSSLEGQLLDPTTGATLDDLSMSGWGVGASFGVLYQPTDMYSFGLNYRSIVKADVKGDATITGAGTNDASLEQTLPTLLTVGMAVRPMEALTLGLSYDFERNSELGTYTLDVDNVGSITTGTDWDDSHTIHLGADYKVTPEISVRAGYARDLVESIPDSVMNRIVGDIAANEVSLGMAYTWQRYTVMGTWNARFGERTIPVSGTTNISPGKYEAFVQAVSLAVAVGL